MYKIVAAFFLFIPVICFAATVDEVDISLRLTANEGKSHLYLTNHTFGPIHFVQREKEGKAEIRDWVVNPLDSLLIMQFDSDNVDSIRTVFSESYSFIYYLNDPNHTQHDGSYLYRLPFGEGKGFVVSQSFHGDKTHNTPISAYAVDFVMDVGTPVHAAREGLVIKTEDQFVEHGGEELREKANLVIILHADGTTAAYVHLDFQGALVKEGESVVRGQKIGFVGMTGYTSGPHLHFVVRRDRDIAVPVYFEGYEGQVLQRRKRYALK